MKLFLNLSTTRNDSNIILWQDRLLTLAYVLVTSVKLRSSLNLDKEIKVFCIVINKMSTKARSWRKPLSNSLHERELAFSFDQGFYVDSYLNILKKIYWNCVNRLKCKYILNNCIQDRRDKVGGGGGGGFEKTTPPPPPRNSLLPVFLL